MTIRTGWTDRLWLLAGVLLLIPLLMELIEIVATTIRDIRTFGW